MDYTIARVVLSSASTYSQSHQHSEPFLEGESHDDYDARTWRSKLNTTPDKKSVVIPAHALKQALAGAAQYSGKKIRGQRNATWTKKFAAGIMVPQDVVLAGVDPAKVPFEAIPSSATGKRGGGARVLRRFPMIYEWRTEPFEVWVLDPQITEEVFVEMLEIAGMFIGIGRFRPENGGSNGRFQTAEVEWVDRRQKVAA